MSDALSAAYDFSNMHILIVEDNVIAMKSLRLLMSKLNVQLMTAVDAELAFELVQSQSFDLMITDIGLPGRNGDELTAMIRALEKEQNRPPMKIVGLTGHKLDDVRQTCMEAGMDALYQKPMDLLTLKQLVSFN